MTILLTLLKQFWPYIAAFTVGLSMGGGAAWKVQGYRLTGAQQEFSEYRIKQTEIIHENTRIADAQREKSANDYAKLSGILDNEINSGVVYRRCVDAGKCGVRKPSTCSAGIRLPATVGLDAAGADAISLISRAAAEDAVINDCAITTLMLNQLQADVEKQAGY